MTNINPVSRPPSPPRQAQAASGSDAPAAGSASTQRQARRRTAHEAGLSPRSASPQRVDTGQPRPRAAAPGTLRLASARTETAPLEAFDTGFSETQIQDFIVTLGGAAPLIEPASADDVQQSDVPAPVQTAGPSATNACPSPPHTPELIAARTAAIEAKRDRGQRHFQKTALQRIQESAKVALNSNTAIQERLFAQGIEVAQRTLTPLLQQGVREARRHLAGLSAADLPIFQQVRFMTVLIREQLSCIPAIDKDGVPEIRIDNREQPPVTATNAQGQPLPRHLAQPLYLNTTSRQRAIATVEGGLLNSLAADFAAHLHGMHSSNNADDIALLNASTKQYAYRNFSLSLRDMAERQGPKALALTQQLFDAEWIQQESGDKDSQGNKKAKNVVPGSHRNAWIAIITHQAPGVIERLQAVAHDPLALGALCNQIGNDPTFGDAHVLAYARHALSRLQGADYVPQRLSSDVSPHYANAPPANTALLWLRQQRAIHEAWSRNTSWE
jgi:hypothetical protein